jgi:hypothetical protein
MLKAEIESRSRTTRGDGSPKGLPGPLAMREDEPRLCPMCGHELHRLDMIDECPWWRYASRWGDPVRAIEAIPKITIRTLAATSRSRGTS